MELLLIKAQLSLAQIEYDRQATLVLGLGFEVCWR
jgi:hypothetical protein